MMLLSLLLVMVFSPWFWVFLVLFLLGTRDPGAEHKARMEEAIARNRALRTQSPQPPPQPPRAPSKRLERGSRW